jgi:hypothetical protein
MFNLISSSNKKKIILTTGNVSLDSDHYEKNRTNQGLAVLDIYL